MIAKRARTLAALLAALLVLAGVGCDGPNGPFSDASWYYTGDGREVYCLRVGHGLSCDWFNARSTHEAIAPLTNEDGFDTLSAARTKHADLGDAQQARVTRQAPAQADPAAADPLATAEHREGSGRTAPVLGSSDLHTAQPVAARAYLLREPLTDAAEHCTAQCTPGTVARFAWSAERTGECECEERRSL